MMSSTKTEVDSFYYSKFKKLICPQCEMVILRIESAEKQYLNELFKDNLPVFKTTNRNIRNSIKKNDDSNHQEQAKSTTDDVDSNNTASTTATTIVDNNNNISNEYTPAKPGFYWTVKDMWAFDNIGFTKPDEFQQRYLCCAGCDLGPLGYVESIEQVQYYCIAGDRVNYT